MAYTFPEEYKEKAYPVDQYVQDTINQGVKRALERNEPYPMPEWFLENIKKQNNVEGELAMDMAKDAWEDCISTALDSFGIKNPPTGNKTFSSKHGELGFSKVEDDIYKEGDIVQLYDGKDKGSRPYHAVMITGFNEEGSPLVSYADGKGAYNKNVKAWWGNMPHSTYRYTGQKDVLDAIENHNIEVERMRQASMDTKPAEPATKGIDVPKADTESFLQKLVDKHNRL